jgi:hypothetical protein
MRHGDPLGGRTELGAGLDFLKSLIGTDRADCIKWPFGGKQPRGTVTIGGMPGTSARAMCILSKGPPSDPKMEATHLCGRGDNGCVNPNHIFWGTHADNHRDMVSHGVNQLGENHGMSKLTEPEVRRIKKLIAAGKMRRVDIGALFGVSRQAINDIASGKNWGWLVA